MDKRRIRPQKFLKQTIYALIALSLFFIVLELILQLIDFNDAKYINRVNPYLKIQEDTVDRLLFWKCPPEFEFRGRRYPLAKGHNTFRIICLGDSVTQGFIDKGLFMEASETYPYRLEQMLNVNSKLKRFEVINAGISGYSSLQGLRYFQRDLLQYAPDIIIVNFGMNDGRPAIIHSDKEKKIPDYRDVEICAFLNKSKTFRFLSVLAYKINLRICSVKKNNIKFRISVDDYKRNLLNIHDIAKQHNIKMLLLNNSDIDLKYAYDNPYNKALNSLSVEYNIPLVDTIKAISKRTDLKSLFTPSHHLTQAGHYLVAEEIYSELAREGVTDRE